VSPFKFMATII